MFDHESFDKYAFEKVPLDRDIYLMDEIYIDDYEKYFLSFFDGGEYENIGYISYAAARKIRKHSIELSWYPNINTRFHEVAISLPRDQFVACVGSWTCDEKPHIFVKSSWLENLHLRSFSVFGFIDAIGVKKALESGALCREKLILLRRRIDQLAKCYPDISFISFGDSLLLKSNWTVGHFRSAIKYSYEPEIFVRLVQEIQAIYDEVLDMSIYAVLTQGSNEYYEDSLLHISGSGNHISLNSLGIPFAQLMSIDKAARKAIRDKLHPPAELYMDEHFYHSLGFVFEFDKNAGDMNNYEEPMMGTKSSYYYAECQRILDNLKLPSTGQSRQT